MSNTPKTSCVLNNAGPIDSVQSTLIQKGPVGTVYCCTCIVQCSRSWLYTSTYNCYHMVGNNNYLKSKIFLGSRSLAYSLKFHDSTFFLNSYSTLAQWVSISGDLWPTQAGEEFVKTTIGRIQYSVDPVAAVKSCDLVVEAIVENVGIKQKLFSDLDKAAPRWAPYSHSSRIHLHCTVVWQIFVIKIFSYEH